MDVVSRIERARTKAFYQLLVDRLGVEAWTVRKDAYLGAPQKTESMVTPVFATPILTTSWLA